MIPFLPNTTVGLLVSGGLDSVVLLDALMQQGCRVQPFYTRGHLAWEDVELAAVRQLLAALASPCLAELVMFDLPADDLYGEHWSVTGRGVPDGDSPSRAVFLPGRNALLLLKPAIWCGMHGIEQLAVAVLATNPFEDAVAEFFREFQSALGRATGAQVRISTPFAQLAKRQVMELGRHLPLELTFSCISPRNGLHCGRCNKCQERRDAFRAAGIEDRTQYAGGGQESGR